MYGLVGHTTDHTVQGLQTEARVLRLEKVLLLLWFVINLILGALTVHEYGMSIDEPNNYQYAADTLKSYPSLFGILYKPPYNSSFDGHGPAFVAPTRVLINMVQRLFPNVFGPDLWHFSYFLTFQLTGLCLYSLAKRWFNRWTAWGILILFGTQPLLLGHAFINPKDIPFMFLLTLSVVAGFRMVDGMAPKESFLSLERQAEDWTQKFKSVDRQRRRIFLIVISLALAAALSLFLFSHPINSFVERSVAFFYTAQPGTWAERVFSSIAGHSSNTSVEDYATKALRLFRRIKRIILIASVLFSLAYFYWLINRFTWRSFLTNIWKQRHQLGTYVGTWVTTLRRSLRSNRLKSWFTEFFRAFRNSSVLLAGVVLGLATAVRAIGPIAGLIVVLYLFAKVRSRAWSTTIAYFLVAGIVTYIAWPRLWDAPIQRYLEGLGIIANFPYPGRVLFAGHLYNASDLPYSYLPILLTIQFTEPLILGIYLGVGIMVWRLVRVRVQTDLLLYTGIGFAFPLLALILLRSPLYHNFRQALFLIPPMVMLAAFTLEIVFRKLTQTWARVALIAVLALPGIYSTVNLYPYEYVYYNSLVGGLAGAHDRYELDYWRISLREMALEMNKVAPPGAKIVVTRSAGLFVRYSRPDLVVDKLINSILDLSKGYDYIVQVTRWQPADLYSDVKNVVSIEREGVVLASAKNVKSISVK